MKKRDLKSSDPYCAAWRDYARVRTRSLVLPIALFYGGAAVTAVLAAAIGDGAPDWLWPAAFVPWLGAAILTGQPGIHVACPRCGKAFHSTSWYSNAYARRCVHCRLPKWAPRDPDEHVGAPTMSDAGR